MKTITIYHQDCNDGTTAAAVVLKKYPDALVFPLDHDYEQAEIDQIIAQAKPGDRILTVDCVIGVKEFLAKGFAVTSIDHHASVKDEYTALAASNPAFTFAFDNDHSGSALAWITLFPNQEIPELVRLVEDQDIWRNKYGADTQAVNNFIFTLRDKPEEVAKLFDASLDAIKRDGATISKYSRIMIDDMTDGTEAIMVKVGPHTVPFYNITSYKSDCGNILTNKVDKTVGLFTIDGEKVKISFRCLDRHSPSAADLAVALGGGGHHNAAGAAMPLSDFLKAIVRSE
ncbi:MAG TPA: DHHA1 domain-containing protein [Candidatus Paceibacterota bacterium]